MLRNTATSLTIMIKAWTTERLTRKDGSPRKRDVKEVASLAEYSAFCSVMLETLERDMSIEEHALQNLLERVINQSGTQLPTFSSHALRNQGKAALAGQVVVNPAAPE